MEARVGREVVPLDLRRDLIASVIADGLKYSRR